jgi:hypothetical protein
MITRRVSAGSITSSIIPQPAGEGVLDERHPHLCRVDRREREPVNILTVRIRANSEGPEAAALALGRDELFHEREGVRVISTPRLRRIKAHQSLIIGRPEVEPPVRAPQDVPMPDVGGDLDLPGPGDGGRDETTGDPPEVDVLLPENPAPIR